MATYDSNIRILLVDDHAIVRAGLCMLIESQPEMKVASDTGKCADAVKLAAREQPDIILIELNMGSENGLDFIPELIKAAPKARVIILTGVRDKETHMRAVRLGARGVVLKDQAADMLLKAVKKVHEGEVWLDRLMLADMLDQMNSNNHPKQIDPEEEKIASLTERERQVISLVAEGLKNKQIAARLFVSEATVRHYLTVIFDKLDLEDRLELAIYSYQCGLAKLPTLKPSSK